MAHVRQIGNTQDTITVKTEHGETLVLTIVAENAGVYAVHYTEDCHDKAGQFVDSEDSQELYPANKDDRFSGNDTEYITQTDNAGSIHWTAEN